MRAEYALFIPATFGLQHAGRIELPDVPDGCDAILNFLNGAKGKLIEPPGCGEWKNYEFQSEEGVEIFETIPMTVTKVHIDPESSEVSVTYQCPAKGKQLVVPFNKADNALKKCTSIEAGEKRERQGYLIKDKADALFLVITANVNAIETKIPAKSKEDLSKVSHIAAIMTADGTVPADLVVVPKPELQKLVSPLRRNTKGRKSLPASPTSKSGLRKKPK
ncbi:MAG: uncharacterized protein KVP18_003302 [Porospora cf. gigantea A]|uniref:uncharacterized protein n=1 Tax=Porospora cf. gigantea A TaxID=2853593 RepID=UPI00355A0108|nr:MAG: hypothetical protein KVP18_003302 [Porospora cf. gigantea A]